MLSQTGRAMFFFLENNDSITLFKFNPSPNNAKENYLIFLLSERRLREENMKKIVCLLFVTTRIIQEGIIPSES